jgi:pimeloyl-ACP methyl ester carboxylesterase
MEQHVDDLVILLDELGLENVNITGTSYGGEVGMMFAARFPERVKRLVVIGCASDVDDELRRQIQRWANIARNNPDVLYDETAPENYTAHFLSERPEIFAAAKERMRGYPPDYFRAFADLCDAFLRLKIDLTRIACPTLVVVGAEDALKPVRYSERIAEGIADAELLVIPGAGHAVVIEKPGEVNDAIRRFCGGQAILPVRRGP